MIFYVPLEILRDNLKKITKIKIGTHEIKIDDLEFIDLPRSNNTKIYCNTSSSESCKEAKAIIMSYTTYLSNTRRYTNSTYRIYSQGLFYVYWHSI